MTPFLLRHIEYVSPFEDVDPENDNIDVHIHLADGRVFSILLATPNNIFWCMENEGVGYFFGIPPVFVRLLDREHTEAAVRALLTEQDGRWLSTYGVLQTADS